MPKRQSRRCVSLRRGTYEQLRALGLAEHRAMSDIVEEQLGRLFAGLAVLEQAFAKAEPTVQSAKPEGDDSYEPPDGAPQPALPAELPAPTTRLAPEAEQPLPSLAPVAPPTSPAPPPPTSSPPQASRLSIREGAAPGSFAGKTTPAARVVRKRPEEPRF